MTETTKPTPKQHHFVPTFYLKGFTRDGESSTQLYVLDQQTRQQYPTRPGKTARQRDYYRIERTDAGDPTSLEKTLAGLEGMLATALEETIRSQTLPKGRDLDLLLNLVALMAIRVPAVRSLSTRVTKARYEKMMHDTVATPEAWEAVIAGMKADGAKVPHKSYKEMKRSVEGHHYRLTVDIPQNDHIETMISLSEQLFPYLAERNWYLTVAMPDAPDLICSDNPVSLSATPRCPSPSEIGHAVRGTVLSFPLNRRMALIGTFEAIEFPSTMSERMVALANGASGRNAERFLFSSGPDFVWLDKNERIRHTADLLAKLHRAAAKI